MDIIVDEMKCCKHPKYLPPTEENEKFQNTKKKNKLDENIQNNPNGSSIRKCKLNGLLPSTYSLPIDGNTQEAVLKSFRSWAQLDDTEKLLNQLERLKGNLIQLEKITP